MTARGLLAIMLALAPAGVCRAEEAPAARTAGRVLVPGYFADPSIVRHDGEWFIYATIDPWGGETLGLWRSRDLRDWTFSTPNWPTKTLATSPTSNKSKVWAPSVIKAPDGRFWMYVSVGSEIWVGTAAHPAGPWRDANGGRPLIPGDYRPGYHMIDAEAFVDDDGQAYLYWGSGLNWVNGRCFVVKLKPDMVTFDGEPRDVTPAHYFEAPFMLKRGGRYYLTYSWGNTTTDTYQVRYAVGSSPLGPFEELEDKPILATDIARGVISPGHHAVFSSDGKDFILYHRQSLPFVQGGAVLRQITMDRLRIGKGRRLTVEPGSGGPVPGTAPHPQPTRRVALVASNAVPGHPADAAGDGDYGTGWRSDAAGSWLRADRGVGALLGASLLRPASPATPLDVDVEASDDGTSWRTLARIKGATGSPIDIPAPGGARHLRLAFPNGGADITEWSFPR